ncbi:MAG: DUF29 domain-containing protein [Runella slithyformis]|nr:MAG: DUF29 domain-containing protein [Runella slithyformis]
MKNWEDIATTSEHHAVVEIKKSFQNGDYQDVEEGLTILIDAMSRSEKKALESQLVRLMHHIVKWKIQPEKQSRSWILTIKDARREIKSWKKYSPSLNDDFVKSIWADAFSEALDNAETETGIPTKDVLELTWEEVFEIEYVMKNWEDIATTSEHHAVVEIKKSFQNGDYQDVEEGLEILLDVMARAEKRAIRSQLIRLMAHIIKWQIQPEKRSRSWAATILNARSEIEAEQEYSPSLNRKHIEEIWAKAFGQAKKEAETETGISAKDDLELTWEEVFEIEYVLN